MTAEKLRDIKNSYNHILLIKSKAENVIKKLKSKNQLTKAIEYELLCAKSCEEIEHLYEPYKERKGSLYEKAVALGLESVSDRLLNGGFPTINPKDLLNDEVDGLENLKKIEDNIKNIIVHRICKNIEILNKLRELQELHRIVLVSKLVKKKQKTSKNEDNKKSSNQEHKFENYFDFSCSVRTIRPHQVLAINRGEKLGILKVDIQPHDNLKRDLNYFIGDLYMRQGSKYDFRSKMFNIAFDEAYSKKLLPLVERQIRANLTRDAERQSIKVLFTNFSITFYFNDFQ